MLFCLVDSIEVNREGVQESALATNPDSTRLALPGVRGNCEAAF